MSSVSTIQKEKVFAQALREFYTSGEQPTFSDILKRTSKYFSDNPIGTPVQYDLNYLGEGSKSSPKRFNDQMRTTIHNMDVLYEAAFGQIQDSMMLSTVLRTELDRLSVRRKKLIAKIDDYLFSLYNPDGYFFSISDNFADTELTDLSLTSAVIDPELGGVIIPSGNSGSTTVDYGSIEAASIECKVTETGAPATFDSVSDFSNGIDGLTNTAWIIQLDRDKPAPITCTLDITFLRTFPIEISKVDITPYGVTPVQVFVESASIDGEFDQFGNIIQSSQDRMVFVDKARKMAQLRLTLIKRTPDYSFERSGRSVYRYIFGAKEIACSKYVYDQQATIISSALAIDSSLTLDHVIDAVSLTAIASVPPGCKMDFFVAADLPTEGAISDYDWKAISPIGQPNDKADVIVHFDGAANLVKYIKEDPTSSELQLIEFNDTDPDFRKRNPSQVIIDGVDIYRIAAFGDDSPLVGSITLEEGVNTTKIYQVDRTADALGLSFWKDYITGAVASDIVFGHVDTGKSFFYGGDLTESGQSVYVETYLESLEDQALIVKSFRKADPNSKQWTIKVFLNGRQLAYLPVGIDEVLIPWQFNKGLNYISLIIDVPENSGEYPNVQIGTLDLIGDSSLFEFGTVKLANWKYVDFFNMQHNQVGQPQTFTIYNNEIISRRKPTTSFRIKYSKATNQAPNAVRVRADLSRNTANPNVTPVLKSYRLRFNYGD